MSYPNVVEKLLRKESNWLGHWNYTRFDKGESNIVLELLVLDLVGWSYSIGSLREPNLFCCCMG